LSEDREIIIDGKDTEHTEIINTDKNDTQETKQTTEHTSEPKSPEQKLSEQKFSGAETLEPLEIKERINFFGIQKSSHLMRDVFFEYKKEIFKIILWFYGIIMVLNLFLDFFSQNDLSKAESFLFAFIIGANFFIQFLLAMFSIFLISIRSKKKTFAMRDFIGFVIEKTQLYLYLSLAVMVCLNLGKFLFQWLTTVANPYYMYILFLVVIFFIIQRYFFICQAVGFSEKSTFSEALKRASDTSKKCRLKVFVISVLCILVNILFGLVLKNIFMSLIITLIYQAGCLFINFLLSDIYLDTNKEK